MEYVGVKYLSSKESGVYDYVAIDGVEIGDIVVAPTQFGISLAQVVDKKDTPAVQTVKQILHIISDSSPVLQEMRDKVKREAIHEEIKKRIEKIVESSKYDEYAKIDPIIKELNDKLKSME